jgi:hypothetical protein
MVRFQANPKLWRYLCFATVVVIFVVVSSCSNQPGNQASNHPANHAAKAAAAKPATPKPVATTAKVTQPAQSAQPAKTITLPKGTPITATVGQTLASGKNHQGDSFAASLATPVKLDGKTVLPKGTHITGKVITVKKHELKVVLASVTVHGKSYNLATNSLRPSDKDQAKSSAKGKAASQANDKGGDEKSKKDNSVLSAKSQLTFKLAKPVTVPVKS